MFNYSGQHIFTDVMCLR